MSLPIKETLNVEGLEDPEVTPPTPCSLFCKVQHLDSTRLLFSGSLISMTRFLAISLCLHGLVRGHLQSRDLNLRVTTIAPVVLALLDHMHLMAPFGYWRGGL